MDVKFSWRMFDLNLDFVNFRAEKVDLHFQVVLNIPKSVLITELSIFLN